MDGVAGGSLYSSEIEPSDLGSTGGDGGVSDIDTASSDGAGGADGYSATGSAVASDV